MDPAVRDRVLTVYDSSRKSALEAKTQDELNSCISTAIGELFTAQKGLVVQDYTVGKLAKRHTFKLFFLFVIATQIAVASLSLPNLLQTTQPNCPSSNSTQDNTNPPSSVDPYFVAALLVTIAGVASSVIGSVVDYFRNKDNDKQQELQDGYKTALIVRETGDQQFEKYLKALQDFMKTEREERNEEHIKRVNKAYQNLPTRRKRSIDQDELISGMISGLPSTNPLFQYVKALSSSTDSIPIHSITSSTEEAISVKGKEELVTTSEDTSESVHGEEGNAFRHLISFTKGGIKPSKHSIWQKIEATLGRRLDYINFKGEHFTRPEDLSYEVDEDYIIDKAYEQNVIQIAPPSMLGRIWGAVKGVFYS